MVKSFGYETAAVRSFALNNGQRPAVKKEIVRAVNPAKEKRGNAAGQKKQSVFLFFSALAKMKKNFPDPAGKL